MKQLTWEEVRKLNYHKELVPLYNKLIGDGKLTKGTSKKREYIEKRVFSVVGKYDVNKDTHMLQARVRTCEDEVARNHKYINELEGLIVKMNKIRSRGATF